MEEVSARTRIGSRCFQRIVMCNLHCFWNWPPDRPWLDNLQPNSVAQKVQS